MTLGSALSNGTLTTSDLAISVAAGEASAQLTVTGTATRPTNLYATTPRDGRWLVLCTFDFYTDDVTNNTLLTGGIRADGSYLTDQFFANAQFWVVGGQPGQPSGFRQSPTAIGWTDQLAAGTTVEGVAARFIGAGYCGIESCLSMIEIGN